MLNVYPEKSKRHLIYCKIKCHFFITIIIMIRRNKMIAMKFKTFMIKVFVFILSNLLSLRDLVDTQQLIFPINNYTIN